MGRISWTCALVLFLAVPVLGQEIKEARKAAKAAVKVTSYKVELLKKDATSKDGVTVKKGGGSVQIIAVNGGDRHLTNVIIVASFWQADVLMDRRRLRMGTMLKGKPVESVELWDIPVRTPYNRVTFEVTEAELMPLPPN